MTNQSNAIAAARDALATINRLTACDCIETLPRTRNCIHTLASRSLRELLIDLDTDATPFDFDDDAALATATHNFMRALIRALLDAPYMTDEISRLALDQSLCPMHFIDYAICFDDNDDECATIRAIFPSHDT